MAGVSLPDIDDLLGHKDLATTQTYAKDSKNTYGQSFQSSPPSSRKSAPTNRPLRQLPSSVAGGKSTARWQPRTPQESLQASLERLKERIHVEQQEIKDLEQQAKQVEQAIKALG
jgi:hypothetical protein